MGWWELEKKFSICSQLFCVGNGPGDEARQFSAVGGGGGNSVNMTELMMTVMEIYTYHFKVDIDISKFVDNLYDYKSFSFVCVCVCVCVCVIMP